MFKFENRLMKIKHEVLTQIALLAKDEKVTIDEIKKIPFKIIPGNIAEYRDTVDHEREVVLERAKLAAGYAPNMGNDILIDLSKKNQIMYVIKSACDKCPTQKFKVTDACRNCIAHKCQSACKFNAISYVNGRAYINPDKCRECGMCSEACPYDAIVDDMRPCKKSCPTGALVSNKQDLSTEITENKCINCGACMASCPFGAIEDKSEIVQVVNELMNNKNLYAVVAPAIIGEFGKDIGYGQIKNGIKALGFKDMFEAACGADAVTIQETDEFIERINKKDMYMTNSCCPAFVSYIEAMFPNQKERISNTVSPMVAEGRYIKNKYKGAKTVFIGPCTAKKKEVIKDKINDAIDYVLTFEELFALFDAFKINLNKFADIIIDDASEVGRGFGMAGGVASAIKSYINEKSEQIEILPVKVSGAEEIKRTLSMAKLGKLQGNFIEGMMCQGGCINGPAKIVSANKAKSIFIKNNKKGTKKTVLSNKELEEFKKINMKIE